MQSVKTSFDVTASGPDLEPGTYSARCRDWIDRGTVQPKNPEFKPQRRIQVRFEVNDGGERPHYVSMFLTATFGQKSRLRQMLEAWRGRPYTPQDPPFQPKSILGRAALLNITVNDNGYADISSVSPLPKGMPDPAPCIEVPIYWSFDEPDMGMYERLHEKTQEAICKSPEWQMLDSSTNVPKLGDQQQAAPSVEGQQITAGMKQAAAFDENAVPAAPATPDFDDEIPF